MTNKGLIFSKVILAVAITLLATSCHKSDGPGDTTLPSIESFTFEANDLISSAPVITDKNDLEGEIVFTVAAGTPVEQLKFTPTITVPKICVVTPRSGVEQDFSDENIKYVVANTNTGKIKTYVVKCVVGKYTDAFITKIVVKPAYKVTKIPFEKDGNFVFHVNSSVTETDLKTIFKPTVTVSVGATVSPESGIARDFFNDTRSVKYTVTSQSGEQKEYTLTCIRDKYKDAKIVSLSSSDPLLLIQPAFSGTDIVAYVSPGATTEQITDFQFDCAISPGATLKTSPLVLDTSVEYTVTSEDEITNTVYTVTVKNKLLFDFNDWSMVTGTSAKVPDREEPNGWATANAGVTSMYSLGGYEGKYCVVPNNDGNSKSVEMVTRYTKAIGDLAIMIPLITSGSAFLGTFKTEMLNPLTSSKFGVNFYRKPLKVKGVYKYKAGEEYHLNKDGIAPNIKDEMAITVVLYEVNDYKETITAFENELNTSPKLVARAYMQSGEEKSVYTPFELDLEYLNGKMYDPTKKYKFSIVFSSSFDGTSYFGAPGSTLIVDDVEIICE